MDGITAQGETAMDAKQAFTELCFASIKSGHMVKGLRQVTKSLISKRSKLLIVSKAINMKEITQVIEGLAEKYEVPILRVDTHEELAEYARICKTDETGRIVKKSKCAVLSIESFGEMTEGQKYLLSRI